MRLRKGKSKFYREFMIRLLKDILMGIAGIVVIIGICILLFYIIRL